MKYFAVLALCLLAFNAQAGKKATTEEGSVVLLNDDGTWEYESEVVEEEIQLKTNPSKFSKNSDSNFTVKSTKTNASFAINTKKWNFKKNENDHESAEYTFKLKDGDLYGMAISEQLEIELEQLSNIAYENAKKAAPDAKIVKREYRMVNGNKVIYMEIVGTIQTIKFKYLGYYYSNASGSTQYIAYTGANLVNKYKSDIDNFLNGFSVNH